ncbi:hypothetical protein P9112_004592 [Eukaryota sp. TZLM1-RC]
MSDGSNVEDECNTQSDVSIKLTQEEHLIDDELGPINLSSRIEKLSNLLSTLFFPLKKTVVEVERIYGSTCSFYFSLTRSVLGAIFLLAVYSGGFLYRHLTRLWDEDMSNLLYLDGLYPGFMLPESIHPDQQDHWATIIIAGYFTVIVFAGMFIVFSARLMYRQKAIREGKTIDTPIFMNLIYSWDWNEFSVDEVHHQENELNENLRIALTEESVRISQLREKKQGVSVAVKVKRVFGNIVGYGFGVAVLIIVLLLLVYEPEPADSDEERNEGLVEMIISLVVSSAIAILNLLGPFVATFAVGLLSIADPGKRGAKRMKFMFGYRMLTLLPLVLELGLSLRDTNPDDHGGCPLNFTMKNIQNLMFIAFILDIIIPYVIETLKRLVGFVSGKTRGKSDEELVQMRAEFQYQDFALKLMYHFVLTIIALPFSPFTPIISFFLAYINASFIKWFLFKFMKPPKESHRNEESRFTFSLYLATMMFFAGVIFSFFVSVEHPCGAFYGSKPMDESLVLHPFVWVPTALMFFAWFRSTVGFTKSNCYRTQLVLRKKASNATYRDLQKKIQELHNELYN